MIIEDLKVWRGEDFAAYFAIEDLVYATTDLAAHVRIRRLDTIVQIEMTKGNGRIVDASNVFLGITPATFSVSTITVSSGEFDGLSVPAIITITGSASDDGAYVVSAFVDDNTAMVYHTFVGTATGANIDITSPGRIGLILTASETLALDFDQGHWDLVVNFATNPVAVVGGRFAVGSLVTRQVGAGDALTPVTIVLASEGYLFDLLDVNGTPTDGQVLTYSFATSEWVPTTGATSATTQFISSGTAIAIPADAKDAGRIIVKNIGANTLSVTITGGDTIQGLPSFSLPAYWNVELFYDGVSDYESVPSLGIAPNVIPTSDFSFSSTGLVTTYTSLAADSDGTIASHLWTFHDASTSALEHPVFTDTVDGTYSTTYQATDSDGAVSVAVTKSYTVAAVSDLLALTGAVPVVSFQPTGLALVDNVVVASISDLQGVSDMSITEGAVYKTAGIGAVDFDGASIGTFGGTTLLDFMYAAAPTWCLALIVDVNNAAYQTLFKTRSTTGTPGVMLHATVAEGDRYRFEQYDDLSVDKVTQTAAAMPAGWVDIVINNDGDVTTFWINGVSQVVSGGPGKPFTGPHDIAEFSGTAALTLRDLRIYDVALSPAQLAERTAAIAAGSFLV